MLSLSLCHSGSRCPSRDPSRQEARDPSEDGVRKASGARSGWGSLERKRGARAGSGARSEGRQERRIERPNGFEDGLPLENWNRHLRTGDRRTQDPQAISKDTGPETGLAAEGRRAHRDGLPSNASAFATQSVEFGELDIEVASE
eukprot:3790257-Rhodomonas_salina.1